MDGIEELDHSRYQATQRPTQDQMNKIASSTFRAGWRQWRKAKIELEREATEAAFSIGDDRARTEENGIDE